MIFRPNLIRPVEMKFTLHRLLGLNNIWNYLDLYRRDLKGMDRCIPSLLRQASQKLMRLQTTKTLKTTYTGEFKVSLDPAVAIALEQFIREIQHHMPFGWEKSVALYTADMINQKTT